MSNGFESYFSPRSEKGDYDVAQICLNGHVINGFFLSYPEHNSGHCEKCGGKTITECPKCNTKIRGTYSAPGIVSFGESRAPAYCYKCGTGYPWTESRLSAAREYVREMEHLSDNEKGILERSLDDLLRDTPKTQVSALRFKQLTAKAGHAAVEGMRAILIDVMAETAKKAIWG
jgi:hypothetical protein